MQVTANEPDRKKSRRKWIIAVIVTALLLAAVFLINRARSASQGVAKVQTGDTVAAFRGDLSASATSSGEVQAAQSAVLSAAQPGTVTAVHVTPGMRVAAGDLLLELDGRDLALQVERMQQNVTLKQAALDALVEGPTEADIAAAEAAVRSAQANLDDLKAGPTAAEIEEYEANLRQQRAAVASASASYNSARDSVSAASLASAEADLVSAQIAYDQAKENNEAFAFSFTHEALVDAQENLRIAQAKVDELRAGPKQGSLNSASADISVAQANLAKTQADYEALLAGPSAAQISAAESTLARALADLADLRESTGSYDIAIAEAELEQAKLDLLEAQDALAETQIVAPYDGLVTDVLLHVGERASGDLLEIVSSDVQVDLQVDELDIGDLKPGQAAQINLEAFPADELSGVIKSIAPSALESGDDVVAFDVLITFDPGDLPILVGMTADARLVTGEREGALLVPNAAISADRASGAFTVNLVVGEEEGVPITESREVRVGLKDRDYTEILSGIDEGDQVLVGALSAPTIDFSGGGFGGGRGN